MNFLREQNDGLIRGDGSEKPLAMITAYVGSSQVYWLIPPFPASAISFKVGKADKSGYLDALAMQYHPTRGLWRVYVPSTYLTARGDTEYKIVALDEYGARHVCGIGKLRVYSGSISDPDDAPVSQEDCYIQFQDGNWRKVTVYTDSTGEQSFSVARDPTDPPSGSSFIEPYAFNPVTGGMFALSGFIDSVGEAYLSVADTPTVGNVEQMFARDASGFYYRIETTQDSTGTMTANVGEKR